MNIQYEQINNYITLIDNYTSFVNRSYAAINDEIQNLQKAIKVKEQEINLYEECLIVFVKLEEMFKKTLFERIEKAVTEAINNIYMNNKFEFKIETIMRKNGTSELKFRLYDKDFKKDFGILHSFGGGIKDIISSVLRIIFSEIVYPDSVIILDEVGKNISVDKQSTFGKFLKFLSKTLGQQIILISHNEEIINEADVVVEIYQENSLSKVKYYKNMVMS